jgi:ribosomal protein S18 acetylase RimI-like enzyme
MTPFAQRTFSFRGQTRTVRPTGASETEAILTVYRQCEDFLALGPQLNATHAMVLADLQHSVDEGGVFCGIYDAYNVMVGVVDFVSRGFEGDPTRAFLSLLMIAAPWRGKGLGAAVVRLVEAEIHRDAQVARIDSGVQVNNLAAIRFWQRCGYTIISGPNLLPDQTTVFHLRKLLGT